MRLSVMATAICISMAALSATDDVQAAIKKRTNIPAQGLGPALHTLATEHEFQLIYVSEEISNLFTSGAAGDLTQEQALQQILLGTGLTFRYLDERTVTIERVSATGRVQGGVLERFRLAQAEQAQGVADQSAGDPERGGLEEVIVTAQKREQALIDVPISITAMSGAKLENAGINNLEDLSFAVPSMAVQELGPGRQNITIRGVGALKGTSSLVGIYLDDMALSGLQDGFHSTYIDVRTTDLERVEVLKGPQGTLFGEGSVGGTVRFIAADPDLTRASGKVSASVFGNARSGDSLSEELRGVINMPVSDEFGVRLAATYENKAGWIDKLQTLNGPVIDEDFNDQELLNVRAKALWRPTDNLTVKGMAVVHRSEGDGSNIVNLDPRKDSHFIMEFEPDAYTGFTDDYELYNLSAAYDFGFAELLSSSSYMSADSSASFAQRRRIEPNLGYQEILTPQYDLEGSSFSQELRLSSGGNRDLHWTLGAYYKDGEITRSQPLGSDFARLGVVTRGLSVGFRDFNASKSWAAFGDVSYSLTERFEIGGGVRYFEEDRENLGRASLTAPSIFQSGSFDATTYRAYWSYAVADSARIYGSVGTGFRSGGFNSPDAVNLGGPQSYGPEEVISYELGTKMGLAHGRVSIEAAFFFSEYTDIQAQSTLFDSTGRLVAFLSNSGEAELRGFELAVTWAATDQLTLHLAGDVTDTEITKVGVAQPPSIPPVSVGDPMDSVPDYSFSVGADYSLNWTPLVPGFLRVNYDEQGETTVTSRNTASLVPQENTPILNFLNLSVGADWNGWELELFARNLLDEAGALRAQHGLNPQMRPTTIGLRFDKAF